MSEPNDIQALSARAERLIDALSGAIMTAAEAAAEKVELASRVAQIQQRAAAFSAVLETVGAEKAALLERQAAATGPMKVLLGHQIAALCAQEVAVLTKLGIEPETARLAVAAADDQATGGEPVNPTHRRDGRRFVRAAQNGDTNGQTAT